MTTAEKSRMRPILVVEDDEDIAESIRYTLEREGYRVRIASTGEQAFNSVLGFPPSLIILDLNLPQMSGFELCRRLRSEPANESDKVLGLELGADDYITKPFSMRELVARIKAALRRSEGFETEQPAYEGGELSIDPATFDVRCEGREVRLTRKEFALLYELARNEGRVMTRESLLDHVWGLAYHGETRTLDVHVRRLRQKLGNPAIIETMTGIGYRLRGSRNQG